MPETTDVGELRNLVEERRDQLRQVRAAKSAKAREASQEAVLVALKRELKDLNNEIAFEQAAEDIISGKSEQKPEEVEADENPDEPVPESEPLPDPEVEDHTLVPPDNSSVHLPFVD